MGGGDRCGGGRGIRMVNRPDELPAALSELPDDVLSTASERLTTRALLWGDDLLRVVPPQPEYIRAQWRFEAGQGLLVSFARIEPRHFHGLVVDLR